MGQRNSSLTRVKPVLGQLLSRDNSAWLPELLQLGSRANLCSPSRFHTSGALLVSATLSHRFEYPAKAPTEYLKALLASCERLRKAVEANPKILKSSKNAEVERKRRLLLEGDPNTIAEGLEQLSRGRTRVGKGTWWVLEGPTMVDCAFFVDGVTIFIEGKRTERKLTERVSWDLERSQVFRNLDALREIQQDKGDFFVLLVVEQGGEAETSARRQDAGFSVAAPSWPHLGEEQARALYEKHYLGYTTWEAIASTFGLKLHDTVSDQLFEPIPHAG